MALGVFSPRYNSGRWRVSVDGQSMGNKNKVWKTNV